MKEIRHHLIRELVEGGKVYKNFRIIHKIIFLIEEYGYTLESARKRLNIKSAKLNRHNYKLYQLRRGYYINERSLKEQIHT